MPWYKATFVKEKWNPKEVWIPLVSHSETVDIREVVFESSSPKHARIHMWRLYRPLRHGRELLPGIAWCMLSLEEAETPCSPLRR